MAKRKTSLSRGRPQQQAAAKRQRQHRTTEAETAAAAATLASVGTAEDSDAHEDVMPEPRKYVSGTQARMNEERARILTPHETTFTGPRPRVRRAVPSLKEFSVTIGRLGADLTDAEVQVVTRWLDGHADVHAYGAGLEAGDTAFHMHLQCVVRAYTTSAQKFKGDLERVLGWTRADKAAGRVDGQVTTSVKVSKRHDVLTFTT